MMEKEDPCGEKQKGVSKKPNFGNENEDPPDAEKRSECGGVPREWENGKGGKRLRF